MTPVWTQHLSVQIPDRWDRQVNMASNVPRHAWAMWAFMLLLRQPVGVATLCRSADTAFAAQDMLTNGVGRWIRRRSQEF